jgi:hypothetical protein
MRANEPLKPGEFSWFVRLAGEIRQAHAYGLLTTAKDLGGYSGVKVVATLQRLARLQAERDGSCYLEVGVFQGLTLNSTALVLGSVPAYGVDNFSQFDSRGENRALVAKGIKRNGLKNVVLVDRDYEDALENLSTTLADRQIGTYFVDGPHDYRSQLMCLLLALPFLSPTSTIVVDDANYRHVRLATRDFLVTHPEWALLFEAYTRCHPMNMSETEHREARLGWWNGVHVLVRDSDHVLERSLPPTLRDRRLQEDEHTLQSAKYAVDAPALVEAWTGLRTLSPEALAKGVWRLVNHRPPSDLVGTHRTMNTFSDGLPEFRMNEAVGD